MTRVIDSPKAFESAHTEGVALLHAGKPAAAVALADSCVAAPGADSFVKLLKAAMYTEGGDDLGRADLVERGAALWRDLGAAHDLRIRYNLANAELALYRLAGLQGNLSKTWETAREHLRSARSAFEQVAADTTIPPDLRLRSLTNGANAYDTVGRYLDALPLYDRALVLDPKFGMALGNRGVALLYAAPFMGPHRTRLQVEAAVCLDEALSNREGILQFGGPAALRAFEARRAQLKHVTPHRHDASDQKVRWHDPHLDWCRRHGLFLHVLPEVLQEDSQILDPLYFRAVITTPNTAGQRRVNRLVDAFNVVKQEFVAARYQLWLVAERDSPIRHHSSEVSERVKFLDSLEYARWGIRTGMAVQAFAATTNVLDKVASFVHLYLGTGRKPKDVSFARLWTSSDGKRMAPEFASALAKPEYNMGLMALCDLSCDLGDSTPLRRRVGLRHTATHRFLVSHTEGPPESDEWFGRLRWTELVNEAVAQLRIGRAALIYLARMIDIHEHQRRGGTTTQGATVPSLELPRADSRLFEYE